MTRQVWVLAVMVVLSAAIPASRDAVRSPAEAPPQTGREGGQVEWLYYGGDPGGTKYSALTDINAGNVQRLQVAWQWKHWETPLEEYKTAPGFFESTPLMIDGVLYVTTPYNSIAALDAETGKELWRFDGEAYKLGQLLSASGWKLRGTAFWRDGGKLRIFLNSRHRLFSLDAQTGKPVAVVRQRRRGVAHRRPAADLGHQARHAELAAGRLPGPGHRRQPGSRPRAAARSGRLRAGVQRAHRQARVDVLGDSAVGEGSRRGDVGERVVAEERPRQRLGADGARRGARPALPADIDAEQRLLRRRAARAPTCSPSRSSVSTRPPAR